MHEMKCYFTCDLSLEESLFQSIYFHFNNVSPFYFLFTLILKSQTCSLHFALFLLSHFTQYTLIQSALSIIFKIKFKNVIYLILKVKYLFFKKNVEKKELLSVTVLQRQSMIVNILLCFFLGIMYRELYQVKIIFTHIVSGFGRFTWRFIINMSILHSSNILLLICTILLYESNLICLKIYTYYFIYCIKTTL